MNWLNIRQRLRIYFEGCSLYVKNVFYLFNMLENHSMKKESIPFLSNKDKTNDSSLGTGNSARNYAHQHISLWKKILSTNLFKSYTTLHHTPLIYTKSGSYSSFNQYTYTCIYMCVYIYGYIQTHIYTHMYIHTYTCISCTCHYVCKITWNEWKYSNIKYILHILKI